MSARKLALIAVRLVVSMALILAIGRAARWPVGTVPVDASLRVAVRVSAQNTENCRDRSAEELEQLPVHMRQKRVCERRLRAYDLTVNVDGQRAISRHLEPKGVRADRPVAADEQVPLSPGVHDVAVSLKPADGEDDSGLSYVWKGTINALAGRIVLITLNKDAGEFVVLGSAPVK